MEDSPHLQHRDKLLRDSFTPAEAMLFGLLLCTTAVTFLIGDPRSIWLLGSLLILGCLSPVVLKTHEHTHPFFIDLLWPRFWLCTAPAWLLLLQFLVGITQNPLATLSTEGADYEMLQAVNIWRPTSALDGDTWITVLGFGAAYIASSMLFIIPKSRSFFERTMPWLCIGAVLIAVFGYIQVGLGLESPLFTKGTGRDDFFAFFPYDGHWAAFASLWCCACVTMALLSTRYDDSGAFIYSVGPWYLTGAILLGMSGLLVESSIPAAALFFTLAVMLLILMVDFLLNSKDEHRVSVAAAGGLTACLSLAAGFLRLFEQNDVDSSTTAFREAAYEMFLANPAFGWGADAYGKILPFFGGDELIGIRSERASSDLLQIAAEFGIFGLLVVVIFFAYFLLRYFSGQHDIRLTNHLMVGCFSILILSTVDTPFMSPAVFLSFFVIFFSAMRWADLSRSKVDEVDAQRPQLVTPESERGVPFFTEQYEEQEK